MQSSLGYLIRSNGGFFSRAEALDCGETDRTLANACRMGTIVRLRRGMYAPADVYQAYDDAGKHLLHAAPHWPPSAVPLHWQDDQRLLSMDLPFTRRIVPLSISFALITALPVRQLAPNIMSSARTSRATSTCTTGLLPSARLARCGKLPVDPAWKVASSLPIPHCTMIHDCLNRLRSCNSALCTSRLAPRQARDQLADGRSESPGESVTRVQFHRFGIPMPELQYHVVDRHGTLVGISDFYWEEHRHLGEFDGKIKYQKLLRPDETPSECVFREKKREDAMRADLRGMTRFIWSDVMPQKARRTMSDLGRGPRAVVPAVRTGAHHHRELKRAITGPARTATKVYTHFPDACTVCNLCKATETWVNPVFRQRRPHAPGRNAMCQAVRVTTVVQRSSRASRAGPAGRGSRRTRAASARRRTSLRASSMQRW